MRMIIIGGPGRSGTTYVANRIGTHAQCAHFFDVELKILSEIDGLADLRYSLCEHYSPPRAGITARRFKDSITQLVNGTYGQPMLAGQGIDVLIADASEKFLSNFRRGNEYFLTSHANFNGAARVFFKDLGAIAGIGKDNVEFFVEKTPHNSLNLRFICEIFPDMSFIHIVRDPRAIALSLLQQIWGPNNIEDSIRWVSNYFEAWKINHEIARQYGIRMKEVKIENLVSNPLDYSDEIQDFVGISRNENIFFDASPESINGWIEKLDAENLSTLNNNLEDLVLGMGYKIEPRKA